MYTSPKLQSRAWLLDVYHGGVIRFAALASMHRLIEWAQGLCEARWLDPQKLHLYYTGDSLAQEIDDVRRQFAQAGEVASLWRAVFEEAALDPEDTYRDRLQIRLQPPISGDAARRYSSNATPLPLHRDTWASNAHAQVNWWGPVYPLDPNRTMAIYPALWDVPIPNNSSEFDLTSARDKRRRSSSSILIEDLLPTAQGEVSGEPSPVLIAPGEFIAFSGNHAHASIPNSTKLTRISLETRTVSLRDLVEGLGAPDVDGAGKAIMHSLFRRVTDRAPLPRDAWVERQVR